MMISLRPKQAGMKPMTDRMSLGGLVVDGAGAAQPEADMAMASGHITAIGSLPESGATEIDARGKLVTTGFVESQTHYFQRP